MAARFATGNANGRTLRKGRFQSAVARKSKIVGTIATIDS